MISRPLHKVEATFADRETDLAWLVTLPDGREVWLPKSTCHRAKDGTFMVPQWIVDDRNLEEFVR